MRTTTACLAALLAAAPGVADAEFFSGASLLTRLEASERIERGTATAEDYSDAATARGYLLGVWDVGVEVIFCSKPGITAGQVRRIAFAYLKANPQRLHEGAYHLALEAFERAFPCARKAPSSPSSNL